MQRIRFTLALLLLAAPVSGQAREPDAVANALIEELQSPFCPGLNLTSCPSPQAAELRDEVRGRIIGGESVEALSADLVRRFGQGVLGRPTWSGFDILAWITPGAVLLLATALLVRRLRRHQAVPARTNPAAGPINAEQRERLQSALDALE